MDRTCGETYGDLEWKHYQMETLGGKANIGRPPQRWYEHLNTFAELNWSKVAKQGKRTNMKEAYIQ